jgi:hypothetical protein
MTSDAFQEALSLLQETWDELCSAREQVQSLTETQRGHLESIEYLRKELLTLKQDTLQRGSVCQCEDTKYLHYLRWRIE